MKIHKFFSLIFIFCLVSSVYSAESVKERLRKARLKETQQRQENETHTVIQEKIVTDGSQTADENDPGSFYQSSTSKIIKNRGEGIDNSTSNSDKGENLFGDHNETQFIKILSPHNGDRFRSGDHVKIVVEAKGDFRNGLMMASPFGSEIKKLPVDEFSIDIDQDFIGQFSLLIIGKLGAGACNSFDCSLGHEIELFVDR